MLTFLFVVGYGAVVNYARGRDYIPRLLAAFLFSLIFMHLDVYTWVVVFLCIWLIGFLPGWGAYWPHLHDRIEDEVWIIDKIISPLWTRMDIQDVKIIGMSLRGLLFTIPILVLFPSMLNLVIASFGLMMGPIYSWAIKHKCIGKDGIPCAEAIWGGYLAGLYFLM